MPKQLVDLFILVVVFLFELFKLQAFLVETSLEFQDLLLQALIYIQLGRVDFSQIIHYLRIHAVEVHLNLGQLIQPGILDINQNQCFNKLCYLITRYLKKKISDYF